MRLLLDRTTAALRPGDPHDLTDADLAALYAAPAASWLRVNMVGTVDGSATGPDGLTGSVNNLPDHRVFALLRTLADGVLVGAGTARAEGYRPLERPLVLVSRRADVPPRLRGGAPGAVLMATCAAAEGLAECRDVLGTDHVLVLGGDTVDLGSLRAALAERDISRVLGEGGPHLLRDLLAAGAVDELDATVVPRLVAGDGPRMCAGPPVDVPVRLEVLVEEDGTLLARWFMA